MSNLTSMSVYKYMYVCVCVHAHWILKYKTSFRWRSMVFVKLIFKQLIACMCEAVINRIKTHTHTHARTTALAATTAAMSTPHQCTCMCVCVKPPFEYRFRDEWSREEKREEPRERAAPLRLQSVPALIGAVMWSLMLINFIFKPNTILSCKRQKGPTK